MPKQWMALISGRTPKVISPTRPREAECIASVFTDKPRYRRSVQDWSASVYGFEDLPTLDEYPICGTVDCPYIACPVSVIEAPLKWEEAGENLGQLGQTTQRNKRSESSGCDKDDNGCQLYKPMRLEGTCLEGQQCQWEKGIDVYLYHRSRRLGKDTQQREEPGRRRYA